MMVAEYVAVKISSHKESFTAKCAEKKPISLKQDILRVGGEKSKKENPQAAIV